MVNLIEEIPPLEELLALPGAHVHLYGKEPRAGRKVGHVTFVGASEETIAEAARLVSP
jgi:5-(carboxyamino)imidazole ribonucleotide synthase